MTQPPPPATPPDPLNSPLLQSKALLWLVVIVTVAFAVVLWPLSGAVSWAVFIAIVFSSLQERSVLVCRGRRGWAARSEEHTSELQSQSNLVCRLLLEKKKNKY